MKRTAMQRKTPMPRSGKRMRASRPKSTQARRSANGMPCQIRIPDICLPGNETVVLCHYRLPGTCGIGTKPDDAQAAYGCAACHDEVDGRTHVSGFDKTELQLMHAEGCFRTQNMERETES